MTDKRKPKGTGSIQARGDRFRAFFSYVDSSGARKRRTESFATKTQARAWLTARLAEVAIGQTSDPRSITVGQYLTDWLQSLGMQQLEAATVSWYRSAVERHIVPALGGVKLARLTPSMVEGFLSVKATSGRIDNAGGLGPASVRRLQVTLHKALDAAVRKGVLNRNPVDSADKPKVPPADVTLSVWTPDEVARFVTGTATDRLGAIWRLAAMTGLRRSEVCGLQWADVDLDGGRLSVRRAVVIVDGMPHAKAPKTAKSRRTVELDSMTVAALREWRKVQLKERLRAGSAWTPGEWLATNEIGEPVRPDRLGRRFSEVAASLGLRHIPMKQLRHSHATALLAAGEPSESGSGTVRPFEHRCNARHLQRGASQHATGSSGTSRTDVRRLIGTT